jgi:hypothetical protein
MSVVSAERAPKWGIKRLDHVRSLARAVRVCHHDA